MSESNFTLYKIVGLEDINASHVQLIPYTKLNGQNTNRIDNSMHDAALQPQQEKLEMYDDNSGFIEEPKDHLTTAESVASASDTNTKTFLANGEYSGNTGNPDLTSSNHSKDGMVSQKAKNIMTLRKHYKQALRHVDHLSGNVKNKFKLFCTNLNKNDSDIILELGDNNDMSIKLSTDFISLELFVKLLFSTKISKIALFYPEELNSLISFFETKKQLKKFLGRGFRKLLG